MWNLLPPKLQLTVLVILATALVHAIGGVLALLGGEDLGLLRKASMAVSVIGIILIPLAEMIWRPLWRQFPIMGRKLFPDCSGVWAGELQSTWKDPTSGQRIAPIEARFFIFQGLLSTSVRTSTEESASHSTRCWLEADPASRQYVIAYTYRNTPGAKVSDRSMQHDGVAWLSFDHTASPPRMTGRYCTTRHTSGDIDIQRISEDPDAPVVHPTKKDAG